MLKQNTFLKNFQSLIGNGLSIIPLSPNHWTIFSLLLAIMGAFLLAFQNDFLLGLIFFGLAAAFDAIDGAVARARGETSAFGGFLDGVVDRFVEALFLIAFMFVPLPLLFIDSRIWLSLILFLGVCMPSFIRSYAVYKHVIKPETADSMGGVCERTERLGLLLLGLFLGLYLNAEIFVYSLMIVIVLSIITILQRLIFIYNHRVS